jgi:hypothetical protein
MTPIRQSFERWASKVGFDLETETEVPLLYEDGDTHNAWIGYRAGYSDATRPAPQPEVG